MQSSKIHHQSSHIATVLIVDDNPHNLDVLDGTLKPFYKVKAAINGELALKIATSQKKPDIILLDIMMPDMDGYEVCKRLKSDVKTAKIPIIFVTAKTQIKDEEIGFELGAVDYISKPICTSIVLARVKTHIALSNQNLALEKLVAERTQELQDTQIEIIKRLCCAAEYKDNDTALHVERMSLYSKFLAQEISTDLQWIEQLYMAAPMHDIGKIAIPDCILLKSGPLDEQEWSIMKKHVEYGVKILGTTNSKLLSMAREITLGHHEQYDGSGYPNGIAGENIPLSARIIAIADAFDALTSKRSYKEAWPVEKAIAMLEQKAGEHFDPILVPKFIKCLDKILEVKAKYQNKFS